MRSRNNLLLLILALVIAFTLSGCATKTISKKGEVLIEEKPIVAPDTKETDVDIPSLQSGLSSDKGSIEKELSNEEKRVKVQRTKGRRELPVEVIIEGE